MFEAYSGLLAWPSTTHSVALALGLAAAAVRWARTRNRGEALVLAVVGPLAAWSFSVLSIGGSVAPSWATACLGAGWLVGLGVIGKTGLFPFALFMGLLTRYALERASGPFAQVPPLEYAIRSGFAGAVPLAAAAAWTAGLVALLRLEVARRPLWAIVAYVSLGIGAAVFFVSPLMVPDTRLQFAVALRALVPCILIVIVVGTQPRLATLSASMAFLVAWIAIVLWPAGSAGSAASELRTSLLRGPAAWAMCATLAAAIGWRVVQLSGRGLQRLNDAPIWAVAMPWITLVPAWYFFGLGRGWFTAFMTANFIAGAILIAGFAYPIGRLDFAPATSRWRASRVRLTREARASLRLLSALPVVAVAVLSVLVPWRWFGTVAPPPVVVAIKPVEAPGLPTADPPRPAPTTQRVRFSSDPSGARVLLDGRPRGVTPLTLVLGRDERLHQATFTLNGFPAVRHAFRLASDPTAQSVHARLTVNTPAPPPAPPPLPPVPVAEPGRLTVNAPYSVELRVGADVFKTSMRHLIPLAPGLYRVDLMAPAVFLRATRQVQISPGRPFPLAVPPVVSLRVMCVATPCAVRLGDSRLGQAPVTVSIAADQEPTFVFESPRQPYACQKPITTSSRLLIGDPDNQQCLVKEQA